MSGQRIVYEQVYKGSVIDVHVPTVQHVIPAQSITELIFPRLLDKEQLIDIIYADEQVCENFELETIIEYVNSCLEIDKKIPSKNYARLLIDDLHEQLIAYDKLLMREEQYFGELQEQKSIF